MSARKYAFTGWVLVVGWVTLAALQPVFAATGSAPVEPARGAVLTVDVRPPATATAAVAEGEVGQPAPAHAHIADSAAPPSAPALEPSAMGGVVASPVGQAGASEVTVATEPVAKAVVTPPPTILSAAAQSVVRFFESVPGARAIEQHLRSAADLHGVDFYLLQALIATESGFNARARSPRGAVGLMQVMPLTAARMGLSGDKKAPIRSKLQDPQTNIHYGTKYFATIQNMFSGRLDLALAAYNAGEGAVQRAGNQVPNFSETRNFVSKVTEIYTSLKARALAQLAPSGAASGPDDVPVLDSSGL